MVLVTVAGSSFAAANDEIIYVSNSGNDTYNGLSPIYDSDTGNGPKATIQNAVDIIGDNGTVSVANGTYLENLLINKNLKLIGAGSDNTFIDGQQTNSVISFYGGNMVEQFTLILSGFTLTNGQSTYGAGMYIVEGTTYLLNLLITNNIATGGLNSGGGVFNNGGIVYADSDSTTITGNYHTSISGLIPDNVAGGGITYISLDQAFLQNNGLDLLGIDLGMGQENPNNLVHAADTIEMQQTGIPVNYIILAILMVIGGFLLPKRK